ncbi:2-phospho-L-lactate guanylyltransferase [Halobellus sp. EA9]|uniref:2-phospho-L-lactate guanylyltransferase n=1 Tax=Halobellus sp. EA9 TaxID=3421647 RepID=UPI003EB8BB18
MRVLVPFTARDPKTRLAPVLDADERRRFAFAMLRDVVSAIRAAGHDPELLVPGPLDPPADDLGGDPSGSVDGADADPLDDSDADPLDDLPRTIDERPLTPAVNAALSRLGDGGVGELAVVMADLALATPAALARLSGAGGDVAIAPGRGGGTNALVVRDPDFRVDYHGTSYRDHRRIAADAGLSVDAVDSMRLSTDVDEPDDLVEVLLHGDGRSAAWLREAGFVIDTGGESRVAVRRSDG